MPDDPLSSAPPANTANAPRWEPDLIFPVLADPVRRGLLLALARDGAAPAARLGTAVGRRLDATLKHLVAMRRAGLLVMAPDPADRRRQLYSLSPSVPLAATASGRVVDFGFCLLRL